MWWRVGIVVLCVFAIAAVVAGKGMWLLISFPAIAATGTNLWIARGSGRAPAAQSPLAIRPARPVSE